MSGTGSLPSTAEVALIGSSGFIGSHTKAALAEQGVTVRTLSRREIGPAGRPVDIRDARELRLALTGATAVVHSAAYIGSDSSLCRSINIDGTRNVVREWQENAHGPLVYVSTAAVYGDHRFHDLVEGAREPAPRTVRSQSRREAELIVLDAGGTVVRPHLVLGHGDRWVADGIRDLLTRFGSLGDAGSARHTAIEVTLLGRVLAELAVSPRRWPAEVFHAGNAEPITVSALIDLLGVPAPGPRSDAAIMTDIATHPAYRFLAADRHLNVDKLAQVYTGSLTSPFSLAPSSAAWYLSRS